MARTPTTNLNSTLDQAVTQPGYLFALGPMGGQTYRRCTFDADFTFAGFTWTSCDAQISGIGWDASGAKAGTLILGDPDLGWWTFAANLVLQDAPILIWQADQSVPDEAAALWGGRTGRVRKGEGFVDVELTPSTAWLKSPRRRVQNVVPAKYLLPAGKVIMVHSTKYVLTRKQNA